MEGNDRPIAAHSQPGDRYRSCRGDSPCHFEDQRGADIVSRGAMGCLSEVFVVEVAVA